MDPYHVESWADEPVGIPDTALAAMNISGGAKEDLKGKSRATDARTDTRATVSDIKIRLLVPQIADPAIARLLPRRLAPEEFRCILSGYGGIPAVANGIRRLLMIELPVKRMCFNYEDLKTNHPPTGEIIITEMMISRFCMVPIDQSVDKRAVFALDVENKTKLMMDVKTGDLKIVSGSKTLPFDSTITLVSLKPGQHLSISNIHISTACGYEDGAGMRALTSRARQIPKDVIMPNNYEGITGVSSVASSPRVAELTFTTNGEMDSREMVRFACDEIMRRVEIVRANLPLIVSNGTSHNLTLAENDTIGTLFMRLSIITDPSISIFVASKDSTIHQLVMKWVCDDPAKTINEICDLANTIYTDIKNSI